MKAGESNRIKVVGIISPQSFPAREGKEGRLYEFINRLYLIFFQLTSGQFSRFPYKRVKPGGSVPDGALLPTSFAPHGLFLEVAAVDDGSTRVAQRLKLAPMLHKGGGSLMNDSRQAPIVVHSNCRARRNWRPRRVGCRSKRCPEDRASVGRFARSCCWWPTLIWWYADCRRTGTASPHRCP
jgi:hypothetical protein